MFPAFMKRRQSQAEERPTHIYPKVDIYHWSPGNGSSNFGDHLNRVIVPRILQGYNRTPEDEVASPHRLFAIGSVMHYVGDGDTVWGTGINGKIPLEEIKARKMDVRAVRGPKTREIMLDFGIDVPEVYGDPALLLPVLFDGRFRRSVSTDFILIPNLHDISNLESHSKFVSPLWGWNKVVDAILGADFVVSSSLHGIILADAFGVPARYLRMSETEAMFKYDDYAQGTGRSGLLPASSVEEALEMGPHEPCRFDAEALLRAFPIDLWETGDLRASRTFVGRD
jgi:pyruvyltransferase